MYGICGNMYHQYTPNVSIYTIHGSYGIYVYIYIYMYIYIYIYIYTSLYTHTYVYVYIYIFTDPYDNDGMFSVDLPLRSVYLLKQSWQLIPGWTPVRRLLFVHREQENSSWQSRIPTSTPGSWILPHLIGCFQLVMGVPKKNLGL